MNSNVLPFQFRFFFQSSEKRPSHHSMPIYYILWTGLLICVSCIVFRQPGYLICTHVIVAVCFCRVKLLLFLCVFVFGSHQDRLELSLVLNRAVTLAVFSGATYISNILVYTCLYSFAVLTQLFPFCK